MEKLKTLDEWLTNIYKNICPTKYKISYDTKVNNISADRME